MTGRRDASNPNRVADEIVLPWDCRPASGWTELTEARGGASRRLRGEIFDERAAPGNGRHSNSSGPTGACGGRQSASLGRG